MKSLYKTLIDAGKSSDTVKVEIGGRQISQTMRMHKRVLVGLCVWLGLGLLVFFAFNHPHKHI